MSKRTGGRLVRPDRVKYPRTYHLPWSSGQTSDDRVLENTAHFAGRRVIVTEKMDGENTTMYRDYIHARSLDSRNHPSRDWVKNLHARIRNGIPLGLRVCGENLFARHTLSYSGLPSFFMVFSIWDENNLCLSWDETVDFAAALGLVTVPLIYDGPWDEQYARNLSASMDLSVQEGFVVRIADAFSYGAFRSSIAKFVRKAHAGTEHNWMRQRVSRNGLIMLNLAALLLAGAALLRAENYGTATPHDHAAQLAERLKSGAVKLPFDAKNGYLPALLKQFHISISSQVLVFSKTSLQSSRISRQAPRAVYFNDDTYVGWVKPSVQFGEVMEITSADPKVGTIFYSMNQQETATPEIKRRDECLHCHVSPQTEGVPGLFVRSVFPDSEGFAVLTRGSFLTDHRSPLSKRWGGWYVSGTHGGQRHMGNSHLPGRGLSGQLDIEAGANQRDLSAFVNTEPYLSPHSDIVALMVLEHQARAQNLIFRCHKDPSSADALADYLLFIDEAALTAPVAGVSGFAAEFAARGPFDGQGRSLREFDLKTRMFRYPLSYMIYSASFDNIPIETRKRVYRRIIAALQGKPALDILRATKIDPEISFPR